MALRLGPDPRCVATTTPRPVDLVRRLVTAPGSVMTRSAMQENAANLAPGFVAAMEAAYAGSVLGRQELLGHLVDDPQGALFARRIIDGARVFATPALDDSVVALDPPATSGPRADACRIVAAGVAEAAGFGRCCFVLGDASAPGLSPHD
jgi:phage terminase large subunit-like protein